MEVHLKSVDGTWNDVLNSARTTVGSLETNSSPSSKWRKQILKAEHSPIRGLSFRIKITDLKSWVSTHLVRHWLGIVHFVQTQRSDRTGIPRDDLPQGALVNHEIYVNAQALINISRKRLCMQASQDTRETWQAVINEVAKVEPELAEVCVRECLYRGFCPEIKTCGYTKTDEYASLLSIYQSR